MHHKIQKYAAQGAHMQHKAPIIYASQGPHIICITRHTIICITRPLNSFIWQKTLLAQRRSTPCRDDATQGPDYMHHKAPIVYASQGAPFICITRPIICITRRQKATQGANHICITRHIIICITGHKKNASQGL